MTLPTLRQLLQSLLLTIALSIGAIGSVNAVAIVHRIDKPLPDELKDRVAELLKRVRPTDSEQALIASKVLWYPPHWDYVIIRVEAGCANQQCMTLVGRVSDKKIDLELTIEASDTVWMADASYGLWGTSSAPPWIFRVRGDTGLVAVKREQGWVLSACSKCTDWGAPPPADVPRPPSPAPVPRSFVEFSQDLDLLRTR